MDQIKKLQAISLQAYQRLPYYLQYLKKLQHRGHETVSAPIVAAHFNYSEIQVRKDFAAVSSLQGKPKQGFDIRTLIYDIEHVLGYHNYNEAVLVGAGSLGKALLAFNGFDNYGINITAAFDTNEALIGTEINGKKILSADNISDLCRRMSIHIGIIAVPEEQAQLVCDQLIAGGIMAVWNFAPVHLSVPKHILVQNENMAASLALLSKYLREQNTSE
jgi:redox-sensing transcriptional repressor